MIGEESIAALLVPGPSLATEREVVLVARLRLEAAGFTPEDRLRILAKVRQQYRARFGKEQQTLVPPSQGPGDVGGGEPEMTLEEAEKRLKDLFAELPVATEVGGTDGGDQCRVLALELAVHMLAAFKILQRGEDLPDGFFRKLNALKDGADEIEVGGGGLGHGVGGCQRAGGRSRRKGGSMIAPYLQSPAPTTGLDEALPRTLTVREAVNALRDGAAVYTSLPLEVGEEKLLVFLDAPRLLARWERSDPEARLRLRMDAEGDLQVMAPLDGEA